jgi:2-haloacid dehalogenase
MHSKNQIDAILLDLGGVLIDWNPRYLYRPHFGADLEAMEDFLTRVCAPEWNLQMDAGKPFAEAVAERQREFPEHAALIALWHDGWAQMLRDAIPETVQILAELRARGHRLFALTNWSAETFPMAQGRFPFLQWFEDIVVSGEVKLAKPDPRIYRLALERNRLRAETTLFVDDAMHNVQAARALGLPAIHFQSPQTLRAELAQRGLL